MKKFGNSLGFSLVEIMITAAALGGLALVGMQMTNTQSKATSKNALDSEIILITNEVVAILSDPAKCAISLGGKNALSTSSGINSMNSKYYSLASGSAPANGYGNANVQITSYALTASVADVAAKNSSLIINFQNKNILKGTSGALTISKKINLYVEVDGSNNITNCRSLSSSSTDIWTRGSSGGIYYSGGNVGIGINSPIASLDVAGGIRPGSSGISKGAACTPEGAIAYDISLHTPVYCNASNVWASMANSLNCTTRTATVGNDASIGTQNTATANCNSDEVVLGGSCDMTMNHYDAGTESRCVWTHHQNFTANGFSCQITNDTETQCYVRAMQISAYARCCKN